MKIISLRSRALAFSALAAVFAVGVAPTASAADATWNGTTDNVWATGSNWSATPVPGLGNTAIFRNAGNFNTTLDLGAGVTITHLTFDTATAAAYTIGSGLVGSQTLTLGTGGIATLTSTVGNSQTINANILLGVDATASSYTLMSSSPSKTLTLAGTVSGNTGGTSAAKTLSVRGAGNTTISGAISNGGASSVGLTKGAGTGDSGTLTLSGNNTYTGQTKIGAQGGLSGGTLLLSGSGKLGTGYVTLYDGTLDFGNTTQTINGLKVGEGQAGSTAQVLIGSGTMNLGGDVTYSGANNNAGAIISGSGVINLLGNRSFDVSDSNIASDDLTISAIMANGDATARSITKLAGAGTLTLNAANTFTGATNIAANGWTLKLDFAASNAPASDILYNAVTKGALNIGTGSSRSSELLVQGKSGTTNSQSFGNLNQTGGSGLASITVNSGASGTMNLSLGTIARSVGSTIAFTGPASGSITTTQPDGRILGATYTTGSGVTTWANVASGSVGAYTGDTLYAGGNIVSNASANLYIDNSTSGNVTQASVTTNLATLSMLDAADRTVAVGTGNTLLLSGPSGGVQNISTAGNLTIGTSGSAGSITAGTSGAHEFIITNGSTNKALTINSVITNNATGSPVLNVTGPGRTVFTGNNTYTGVTTVNGGLLEIQNNNALGTTAGATIIAGGATLGLSGGISTAEDFIIGGNGLGNGGILRNISGSNTLSGNINVADFSRINSDAGTLALTGSFSNSAGKSLTYGGSGNTTVASTLLSGQKAVLIKDGTGTLTLQNSASVSSATVNQGILTIASTSAKPTGTVTAAAAGTIGLGVGGAGFYNSADVDSLFANTLTGFTMNAASGVAIDTSAGDFTHATNQGGTRSLTKLGANTLTLTGSNTYSGATTVSAGTLLVSGGGSINNSNTSVRSGAVLTVNGSVNSAVSVSGILSGTGTVGAVTVASGGTLAPGNSPGILNVSSLTGTSGAFLSMEIGKSGLDPVAGTDYDQVNSTGAVTLGGMTLNLTPATGTISLGDKIFLVLNGSASAVGGTFAGLAQDQVFSFNSQDYQISYVANWTGNYATSNMIGGNDVALLAVPEPSTCLLLGLGLMVHVLRRRSRKMTA